MSRGERQQARRYPRRLETLYDPECFWVSVDHVVRRTLEVLQKVTRDEYRGFQRHYTPGESVTRDNCGAESLMRAERFERRHGNSDRKGALRRRLGVLQSVYKHLNRLARVGRNIDCGGQKTAAHPGLPCFRKSVAAKVRDAQPSLLLDFRRQLR